MANISCSSCEDLRQTASELIVNGFTDEMCTSLQNDTGLVASSGNDDCTDLNNMNDCLVGNMATEIDSYDVCDWKTFMKKFIPNVWTTLKGIICAICGLWTRIHCIYNSLVNLVDALADTTGGRSFVRYYRDNSGAVGTTYQWPFPTSSSDPSDRTLNMYMDADVDNPGSQVADRDYVVIITYCNDVHKFSKFDGVQVWYSSADTRPLETIKKRQAQHPCVHKASPSGEFFRDFSWSVTQTVMVKKGAYLKFCSTLDENSCVGDSDAWYRVHQIESVWIPANIDSSIDPSDILEC